jgi:hypothetical protein
MVNMARLFFMRGHSSLAVKFHKNQTPMKNIPMREQFVTNWAVFQQGLIIVLYSWVA